VSTRLFGSASVKPGKTGTFFYNEAFKSLLIDARYEAWRFADFDELCRFVYSGKVAGLSISMPFKQQALELCDALDSTSQLANSVNTLTFGKNGEVRGYSSDLFGVRESLCYLSEGRVSILGDGAISQVYQLELKRLGREFTVYSRKRENWNSRYTPSENLINCTPIGMVGQDTPVESLKGCRYVVDLVIGSSGLRNLSIASSVTYFSGMDFYREVFQNQFRIYTGQTVPNELYDSILEAWIAKYS